MSNETMNRWGQYRPSKTVWFWSCAGTAVLTMAVGFGAGGWVTAGTAAEQVASSSEQAVATLAASICANRFLAAPDAQTQLTQLKEIDAWKQDNFIEDGGWVTFASMEQPVDGAADLCADKVLAGNTAATSNDA